jgi:ATP-dependent RNA helicase DeaD
MKETSQRSFADLGLREPIVRTLDALGYEAPTPIQERTIPVLLSGRDLIGQAQTGTGKTAAFALPILEKIDPEQRQTQALVLTPTRELAMQVAEALHSYSNLMREVVVLPVYGGAPIVHQLKRLERGVHVVVGTPGRLIDHLDRKSLKLDAVRIVVLDEADEMLKMGFIDDVERILAASPEGRQIALFSATMPEGVVRIAERHMARAERVEIEHKALTAPAIEQRFLNVSESQKLDLLTRILELEDHEAVLIFRRTKNGAAELAERLQGRGFPAEAMHGDMNQSQRESVIRRIKGGHIEIVVATDVAARGLDVEQVSHVINYDIPNDVEAYVHRIGRTGRAGRSGAATLFVTPRERRMMREIERFTGTSIKPMRMPTVADVAARRVQQLKESIRKNVEEGDLEFYLQMVEDLVEEGRHDIAEIAAAAARMASIARPIAAERDTESASAGADDQRSADTAPERARKARPFERPERPQRTERSERPPRAGGAFARPGAAAGSPREEGRARLVMSVGKNEGIRPADVVGSIANEADIPGREIGPIEILDDVTYVTIPADAVGRVIGKVGGRRFRGKVLDIRVAEGDDRPRPPRFGEREGRAPAPRRNVMADAGAVRPSFRGRSDSESRRPSTAPGRFRSREGAAGERENRPGRPFNRRGDGPPPRSRGDFGKPRGGPKGKGRGR